MVGARRGGGEGGGRRLPSWAHARWVADPTLRIYHYGAYEITALQADGAVRDAGAEFDDLLRGRAFIDLYDVVRRALLLGTPSYSIKYVERLYRDPTERETAVAKGDESLVVYDAWLNAPDGGADETSSEMLRSLLEYNRDDASRRASSPIG